MRFLTILMLLAALSCKNNSTDTSASTNNVDSTAISDSSKTARKPYVYTFMDTILVSLGARDFAAVTKLKPNMPILDLRPESQFKQGHIWRSVNMNPDSDDFYARIASFGRDQEYALYCQFGNESLKVAEEMKAMGFLRIYHLQRGLTNWGETGQALQLK